MTLDADAIGCVLLDDRDGDRGRRRGVTAPARWCACRSARRCSAASSIRSAARSTAASRSPPRRRSRSSARRRRSSSATWSTEPVQTGMLVIDALFALGRGQRELIIGDRATGKTALAVDTIINQKHSDMICVYVAVGQKTLDRRARDRGGARARRARALHLRRRRGRPSRAGPAMDRALCRHDHGRVFPRPRPARADRDRRPDQACRHPPRARAADPRSRRGARPIRATSSTSMRACWSARRKLSTERGGGSLTALPIAETDAGNLSAYIPTNLISITDGQIVLDAALFHEGQKPGGRCRAERQPGRRQDPGAGAARGGRARCGSTTRSSWSWRCSPASAASPHAGPQARIARGERIRACC